MRTNTGLLAIAAMAAMMNQDSFPEFRTKRTVNDKSTLTAKQKAERKRKKTNAKKARKSN